MVLLLQNAHRHLPAHLQTNVLAFSMQCLRYIARNGLETKYASELSISKSYFDMVLKCNWQCSKHAGISERGWWDGVKSCATHIIPEADFIMVLNHPANET